MRTSSLVVPASLLLSAPLALAAPSVEPVPLDVQVQQALELSSSKLLDVTMIGQVGEPVTALLHLDGVTMSLALQPHSVRGPGHEVRAQAADGTWTTVDPGPVRTLRGTLAELPGSTVAASWTDAGLEARVRLVTGEDWWIQPLDERFSGAGAAAHVLYRSQDVAALAGCGVDQFENPYGPLSFPRPDRGPKEPGGVLKAAGAVCELATDADYEYFQDWGSVSGVQTRIESVVNVMNLQYEAEVGITHQLGTQLVRTSGSQPYKSKNASKLLQQVRSEWLTNQSGVQRDVVQLFTGKVIGGSTIGIAWLGVICDENLGYSMVQSDFNGNFASATDLSAHELGHNWNAGHCSCTSHTMNPYIVNANTFHPTFTRPVIEAFRDASTCLGDGGGGGGGTGGGTPTDLHVQSVQAGTISAGKGAKYGGAIVTITDDLGNPMSGVSVTGAFSGTFNESAAGTTGADGTVLLQTSGTAKGGVAVTFCVTGVSGGALPYDPADDVMTCDSN